MADQTAAQTPKKKTEGSVIARKGAARLAAVQILYQARLNNQDLSEALREFINHPAARGIEGETMVTPDEDLLEEIITGIKSRWSDVDDVVTAALAAGKKGDVEPLLESVLRAGAYELLAHGSTDAGIIISDYLNVTTGFYDGAESKLVNAVLDKVAKSVRG